MKEQDCHLNIRISKEMIEQLRQHAQIEDRPLSRIVRQALLQYLKQQQASRSKMN